jgi:hypothetical protein
MKSHLRREKSLYGREITDALVVMQAKAAIQNIRSRASAKITGNDSSGACTAAFFLPEL